VRTAVAQRVPCNERSATTAPGKGRLKSQRPWPLIAIAINAPPLRSSAVLCIAIMAPLGVVLQKVLAQPLLSRCKYEEGEADEDPHAYTHQVRTYVYARHIRTTPGTYVSPTTLVRTAPLATRCRRLAAVTGAHCALTRLRTQRGWRLSCCPSLINTWTNAGTRNAMRG
jgi:hypothetical protein